MILRICHTLSLFILAHFLLSVSCVAQTPPADAPKPHAEVMPLLEKGFRSFQERKWSDSMRFYEEAMAKARDLKDLIGESEALNSIGNIHYVTGQPQKALPFYEQALPLRREGGFKRGEAVTLNSLGRVYSERRQMAKAMECYEQALTLFRQIGDKDGEGRALDNISILYARTGQLDKALTSFEQALTMAKQTGNTQREADTLSNIGNVYRIRGQARQAQQQHEQALLLYRQQKDQAGESKALTNLGNAYYLLGELPKALDSYEQSLALDRESGDKRGEAMTRNNLGNVYRTHGQWQRALHHYEQVLPFFREIGDKHAEARVLTNLGASYQAIGQPQKALEYFEQVLSLDRELGDQGEQAGALHSIASVYADTDKSPKALQFYEQSLRLRRQAGDKIGEANTLNSIGLTYDAQGQAQKAIVCYEQVLPIVRELGDRGGEGATLTNLGNAYFSMHQFPKALQYYKQALPIHKAVSKVEFEAHTLSNMGRVYTELGEAKNALACFREGLELRESYRRNIGYSPSAKLSYLSMYLTEYQRYIALLVQQKQTSEAFAWTQKIKARVLLDIMQNSRISLSRHLPAEEQQQEQEIRQRADTLNTRIVAESVENGDGAKKRVAALQEELKKVESDWQTFSNRLLTRYPDLAIQSAARTATLTEVARFLPEDTALLEYVCLRDDRKPARDQTLLLVVTQRGGKPQISLYTLPGKSKTRNAQIDAFRKACADPTRDWQERSRALYATLIAPAEKSLQGKKRLIICPDSTLWDVPFAALTGEKEVGKREKEVGKREKGKGKSNVQDLNIPLLKRFTITYAYSATGALAAAKAARDPQRTKPTKTLLAMTNPAFGGEARFLKGVSDSGQRPLDSPSRPLDAPSRVLPALVRGGKIAELPGTQREADALKRDFPEATILNRERAQETAFKNSAAQYRYLHLATHGFTNDITPMMSSLILAAPPTGSTEDGFLTAREIAELNLCAEMAVLSACNTGRGEQSPGEGVIGLTWALFVARCPSSVVSQWSVSDRSTAQLMTDFYHNLKQGQTKAASLRSASVKLMQQSQTAHPYYWAPFVLIGDGN